MWEGSGHCGIKLKVRGQLDGYNCICSMFFATADTDTGSMEVTYAEIELKTKKKPKKKQGRTK